MMNIPIYNSIGSHYNSNRSADSSVTPIIKELLGLTEGSIVADIGAGTGNYSNALADLGYRIKAVEPSEEMRKQAKPNTNGDEEYGYLRKEEAFDAGFRFVKLFGTA